MRKRTDLSHACLLPVYTGTSAWALEAGMRRFDASINGQPSGY